MVQFCTLLKEYYWVIKQLELIYEKYYAHVIQEIIYVRVCVAEVWQERNPEDNPEEVPEEDLLEVEQRARVEVELRRQVDHVMRHEIQRLKEV